MKNVIVIAIFGLIFSSCKKEFSEIQQAPASTVAEKRLYYVSEITESYVDSLYNTCLNEWVYLKGTVNYSIKESFDDGYYLDYIIEVRADGVSESGIEFKGGGKSVGKVRMTESGDVKSRIFYDIRYTSPGGNKMGYFQQAHFVEKDSSIQVEFNKQEPTCE